MIDIEIRAAEGGEDSRLLIDVLAGCYKRRAQTHG
jgi:protein subunit release factor A